ncbi:hypothetical protein [uncultured Roseibium sp.]|uniref:hypothetical protein n=1 Tax=uncultured Roseibium sp. TaxID=1936171 RepID=UPI00260D8366|nr:hypothetical protein [uncultured Roseibium sp.]
MVKLSQSEKKFLRLLNAGRHRFVDVQDLRLHALEEAGLLRRIGAMPLDVVLTGEGRKFLEDL